MKSIQMSQFITRKPHSRIQLVLNCYISGLIPFLTLIILTTLTYVSHEGKGVACYINICLLTFIQLFFVILIPLNKANNKQDQDKKKHNFLKAFAVSKCMYKVLVLVY